MLFQVEISQLVDENGNLDPHFPTRDFLKVFKTIIVRNIARADCPQHVLRGKDDGKSLAVLIDYGADNGAGELSRVHLMLAKCDELANACAAAKRPSAKRKAVSHRGDIRRPSSWQ